MGTARGGGKAARHAAWRRQHFILSSREAIHGVLTRGRHEQMSFFKTSQRQKHGKWVAGVRVQAEPIWSLQSLCLTAPERW